MKRAPTKKKPAKKTKKPDPTTIRRRIRDRNRRFRALSREKKRIAIAKDVIAQLDAKKIVAESGMYFSAPKVQSFLNKYDSGMPWGEPESDKVIEVGETQVCDLLADAECTVCGIGAAFVSAVRLGGQYTVKDTEGAISDTHMREYLNRYFDPAQVTLIECAFEQDPTFANEAAGDPPSDEYAEAAASFGEHYPSDAARMRAIFQNIIDNKGTFKPPAVKDDDQEAQ